jgi:hypothetical protein
VSGRRKLLVSDVWSKNCVCRISVPIIMLVNTNKIIFVKTKLPFQRIIVCMRFQVLMVVSMKMNVFWDVVPCGPVQVYWCFGGACCLHHQDDHCPDDGDSKNLWNVGKLLSDRRSHPSRQSSSHDSLLQLLQINSPYLSLL